MASPLRAAADIGLRTARMRAAGRFTPNVLRSYSEAGIAGTLRRVPIVGSLVGGPGASETIFDRITTVITGTFFDPSTRMGAPPETPPDWKTADGIGDTKYAFYTEGVNAGFVRGTFFGALVAGAGAAVAWHLRRRAGA